MNEELEILSEEEDRLLGQLKSLFYYPTEDFINLADQALSSLSVERREILLRTLYIQLGFEQAERRRYIFGSLFGPTALPPREQEMMVYESAKRSVGDSTNNLIASRPSTASLQPTLTEELVNQVRVFTGLDKSLNDYRGHLYEKTNIGIYYDALKHLPLEQQQKIASATKQFIDSIEQTGDKIFTYNPELPETIVGLLKETGLDLIAGKFQSLGDKLEFLSTILAVSEVLVNNRSQTPPLDDNQLKFSLAVWLSGIKEPSISSLVAE